MKNNYLRISNILRSTPFLCITGIRRSPCLSCIFVSACPPYFKAVGFVCYFISTGPLLTWQSAEQSCQEMDSHLITIENEEEEIIIEHELGEINAAKSSM